MNTSTLTVSFDRQDPSNEGWAYSLVTISEDGDRSEETGELLGATLAEAVEDLPADISLRGLRYEDLGGGARRWTWVS